MFTTVTESSTHIANGTFDYNSGSLYSFNSNLIFSGYTRLENCAEQLSNKTAKAREEGGVITSVQSTVHDLHWSKQIIKQPSKAWWSNIRPPKLNSLFIVTTFSIFHAGEWS